MSNSSEERNIMTRTYYEVHFLFDSVVKKMEFATFFNPKVLKFSSLPICTTYMYYQSSTFLYDSCEVFLKITSTNLNCYSSAGTVVWKSIRGMKIDKALSSFSQEILKSRISSSALVSAFIEVMKSKDSKEANYIKLHCMTPIPPFTITTFV
jgi:hypothetical protein